MLTFISGGARSGKSTYAERVALECYSEQVQGNPNIKLYYLATAQAFDREMKERIALHAASRVEKWITLEEPYEIGRVFSEGNNGDVFLVDCLTLWVSNMMFSQQKSVHELLGLVKEWVQLVKTQKLHVVIVSNDLNEDVPSRYSEVEQYRQCLGALHQLLVANADQAIQVVAGIPMVWKGGEGR